MQQLFNDYVSRLTSVYSSILEDVDILTELMTGQRVSRNSTSLESVIKFDREIPKLECDYPQFSYLTKHIFQTEEMFDSVKRRMAISPELFPQYERGKNILIPVLLAELASVSKEKDCNFLLDYLEKNNLKETCWGACFSHIYKNHFSLRKKVTDMFYAFLDQCEALRFPCGDKVISIFDGSQTCIQDMMKLLQKIYEKSNPNYDFSKEKKALDKIHFFHHCSLKDIPKEYVFIRMLYHTRFLNAPEFKAAYSCMSVSKMLEYDFGLAQRILPRLFSRATNLPFEDSVNVVRGKEFLPFFDSYLENQEWLPLAALAFAEVFGIKYEAYLNKIKSFIPLQNSASFIKDIDYGNPKNKMLGEFLLNNVIYQKENGFHYAHDLSELESICHSWKNIPPKEIKTNRYGKILSLCNTYCYKNIHNVPFSKEAMYWKMAEKDYVDAENAYIQAQSVPDAFDTKTIWKCGEYVGRFLPRDDVRIGFFGHYTGCCQHYTGTGASAAISCVKDPSSQLFVIERNGRIIAGSFVWKKDMDNYKGVCFDSVEVLSSYERRKEVLSIYQNVCKDLSKDYQKITFGKTPFDLEKRVSALPIPDGVYTDARAQFAFQNLQNQIE